LQTFTQGKFNPNFFVFYAFFKTNALKKAFKVFVQVV